MMFLQKNIGWIACVFVIILALILGLPGTAQTASVKPVVIRDLDNGDRAELYIRDITVLQFDGLRASDECLDLVPAGKRLIVEHVTARVRVPIGQSVYAGLKIGGIRFGTFVPLVSQGILDGTQLLVSSTPAKLRIGAGDRGCMLLARDLAVGQATGLFTLSGYVIDVP
ncbi:hypothetical protein [Paludibaculum fermentans]|uniref:hypothetical protein n=1 Tax=Paludibaculum fermentans TaxID=1473598 RepID=UPI003EBFB207